MLNKEDRAIVRDAARGLTGAAKSNFENAVIARLQAPLDGGVIHAGHQKPVRAACSAKLLQWQVDMSAYS